MDHLVILSAKSEDPGQRQRQGDMVEFVYIETIFHKFCVDFAYSVLTNEQDIRDRSRLSTYGGNDNF